MDQNGWIKLYRALSSKGFYQKSEYVHLWIHLLIKADHSGKQEIMFAGKPYKLKPGEFSTGRKMLAKETGIHESNIQRILSYFEKIEHQIEQRTDRQCRIISIVKWDDYQNLNNESNNDRTTTEQRVNTKQECKNNKNERNNNILSDSATQNRTTHTKKLYSNNFEEVWDLLPTSMKVGKKNAYRHYTASVKTQDDYDNLKKALENYKNSRRFLQGFVQNGSTWFNNWQDWIDYHEPEGIKQGKKIQEVTPAGYTIYTDGSFEYTGGNNEQN